MPTDFFSGIAPSWLGRLAVQQDLGWFFALLIWGLALVLWRRTPGRHDWRWLPWAAGTGILSAFVQFWIFNPPFGFFYERLVAGTSATFEPAAVDPNLFGDIALAAVFAAGAAGWWWQALGERAWLRARWLVVLALAIVVALEMERPEAGAWLLAVAPLPVAIYWWRKISSRWSRWTLGLAALVPLCSTIGPVAMAVGALQRHGPPTVFGLAAAGLAVLTGGLALVGLVRCVAVTTPPAGRGAIWRDAKPFCLGAAAWLGGGLGYAFLTGRDNVDEVRLNRLRLVVSEAHSLDPATIAPLVAATTIPPDRRPVWSEQRWVYSAGLARVDRRPAQEAMRQLVHATPFLQVARFVTLRDGWLVAVVSNQLPARRGFVELLRRATPADEADWSARRNLLEQSPVPEIGQPYFCRAAVSDRDGRMLGWLEFVREEFYSTTVRKWRAEPLLVTALGVVLAAILFAQRRDAKERSAALRAAVMADEASRLKTSFLAKVSHELRTPLQSILGYSELLQRELPAAAGRAQLAALRQSGELMLRLVNDLLDLSAIEAGAFRFVEKPVALRELVAQTVESFRPRAEMKGLSLEFHDDPAVPAWVASDPERLRQIVVNLLGNAVKFTDRGGVTVGLALRECDGTHGTIEISVRDTGPGIAPEDRPRLFQPFSRLEPSGPKEGAGLGLALVSALCRNAGGGVDVESAGPGGSCFRARLRCQLAVAPEPVAEPQPVAALTGRRVLVADDNRLVRELFVAWLTDMGATCAAVEDGEQALTAARAGTWDALVLDLAMPRLGGREVAARLRAEMKGSPLRIVGVSAHARPADRAAALAAGMDAFLTKPVERTELAAAVAAIAGQPGPEPDAGKLRARLEAVFRAELPQQLSALAAALARHDWAVVADRAHWLKNSGAVLDEPELFTRSAELEEAAENKNAAAVAAAWVACRTALRPWQGGADGLSAA